MTYTTPELLAAFFAGIIVAAGLFGPLWMQALAIMTIVPAWCGWMLGIAEDRGWI